MSTSVIKSNNHTATTTTTSAAAKLAKKKEERVNAYKQNKGFWEAGLQRKCDPNDEAKIKRDMKPPNTFNPTRIHDYIDPSVSNAEIIIDKKANGEFLNSKETIIYNNLVATKEKAIKEDFDAIENLGISAPVKTIEGKTKRLLHTLRLVLKKADSHAVANIFLRLQEEQFLLTEELTVEYEKELKRMEKIVSKLNMIELQFTCFHAQMPPLNNQGFNKLDDWQIKVIENIDNEVSTVVNAFTSAGKSVLSGYVTVKGRTLYVVPTDALAWQMAAYIGDIIGKNVPIITKTYQSNPSRDAMIKMLNGANAIVGTADAICDFLPFIKSNFKWIVFDEIHMIGKPEGSEMEHIVKVIPDALVLALSATIGNTDELVSWFQKIAPTQPIEKVICTKRFFNLQRAYYDSSNDELTILHPLALIEENQIADESLLTKSLQPTPPNAWDLAMKLMNVYALGDLDPNIYFANTKRIELTDAYTYFAELIKFVVSTYQTDPVGIMKIINMYKNQELTTTPTNLLKLAFKLKKDDKLPAVVFIKNTSACLRIAREFAKSLEAAENEAYPDLQKQRNHDFKKASKTEKQQQKKLDESTRNNTNNSKKELKQMLGTTKAKQAKHGVKPPESMTTVEDTDMPVLQEPHSDYILNKYQCFTEGMIEEIAEKLKKYFPKNGERHHFIMRLLWRGVGVYAKGLPDQYLRIIQTLANKKQLGITFSDTSLAFGVSMPVRTSIIMRDEKSIDNLDSMLYNQMAGRAGRRGLDKEGYVVFAGYSWKRIKELSISDAPIVIGSANPIQTIPHGNRLSEIYSTEQNWDKTCENFLDKDVTDEDGREFVESIKSNFEGSWACAFAKNDPNHLIMTWRLRHSNDCIIVPLLLPYLIRAFTGKDHTLEITQINIAHILCRFVDTKKTTKKSYALEDPEILTTEPYCGIKPILEKFQIDTPDLIDNRVFMSIKQNSVVKCLTEDETEILRNNLLEFYEKVRHIQHYCFHENITGLCKILGKLMTRIWWIYHSSSPLTRSIESFDTDEYKNIHEDADEESDAESDADSDAESDEELGDGECVNDTLDV